MNLVNLLNDLLTVYNNFDTPLYEESNGPEIFLVNPFTSSIQSNSAEQKISIETRNENYSIPFLLSHYSVDYLV